MPEVKYQRFSRKLIVIAALVVLVGAGSAAAYFTITSESETPIGSAESDVEPIQLASEAIGDANILLNEGDIAAAVEKARQAVEISPQDIDILIFAAYVIENEDPEEARQLYARALGAYKLIDNPDEDGKDPSVYWAAGDLAEKAGDIEQAILYYQKALDSADFASEKDKDVVDKSSAGIERLQ